MRRFTILGLMVLILAVAIAAAALRNADDYWAGGLLLGTTLLIGVTGIGAFYHSGRGRANRLGFVVFAGGYFALVFLGLSEPNLAKFPTSWLLLYVHQRVAPPQPVSFVYTVQPVVPGTAVVQGVQGTGPISRKTTITATASPPVVLSNFAPAASPAGWSSFLPGAANYQAFSAVGHCLFSVVAGMLGMLIARRYWANLHPNRPDGAMTYEEKSGERSAATEPSTSR